MAELTTVSVPSRARRRKGLALTVFFRAPHETECCVVHVGEGFNSFPLELPTKKNSPGRNDEHNTDGLIRSPCCTPLEQVIV